MASDDDADAALMMIERLTGERWYEDTGYPPTATCDAWIYYLECANGDEFHVTKDGRHHVCGSAWRRRHPQEYIRIRRPTFAQLACLLHWLT